MHSNVDHPASHRRSICVHRKTFTIKEAPQSAFSDRSVVYRYYTIYRHQQPLTLLITYSSPLNLSITPPQARVLYSIILRSIVHTKLMNAPMMQLHPMPSQSLILSCLAELPHIFQMPNHSHIRIHVSIHAILHAGLFTPV